MKGGLFSANSSLISPKTNFSTKFSYVFNKLTRQACCLCALLASPTVFATNYYLEREISLALQQSIDEKQIVWLETDNPRKTLALNKIAQGVTRMGTAIVLADLNHHPDWPTVTRPIRDQLPYYGWETLSVHMPIKEANLSLIKLEQLYKIAEKRITAAIEYLISNDKTNIIIIGHRHSANIGVRYITQNQETAKHIKAIVGISSFDSSWINTSAYIKELPIGMLDIIAQNDTIDVKKAAPQRLVAARFAGQQISNLPQSTLSPKVRQLAINKTGNPQFRQSIINGANRHFTKKHDALIKTIRGWLKVYATSLLSEN